MSKPIRVLGIDPGFASVGIARLAYKGPGDVQLEALGIITTKKASKKKRAHLRVSADDVQRAHHLWKGMAKRAKGVDAVAYEVYTPFQKGPKRTADGTKTAMACGLALGLGFSLGVPVIPVLPSDIKCEIAGKRSASKSEVQQALCANVAQLSEELHLITPGQQNHVSDAAAVAFVGLSEILRWRELYGPQGGLL